MQEPLITCDRGALGKAENITGPEYSSWSDSREEEVNLNSDPRILRVANPPSWSCPSVRISHLLAAWHRSLFTPACSAFSQCWTQQSLLLHAGVYSVASLLLYQVSLKLNPIAQASIQFL